MFEYILSTALPFHPVSGLGRSISYLFLGVFALCIVILAIVVFFTISNAIRFRDKGQGLPPQNHGNHKLEITWTALPLLSLVVVYVFTIITMHASDPSMGNHKPDIVITGHQWWWEIHYPKSGVTTANELHMPTGKALLVELKSVDVIHTFWVRRLGRKMEMIPGHPNYIWIKSDKPGVFHGECAQFCGAEHAWMRFLVFAQSPARFAAWERDQLRSRLAISQNPRYALGAKEFDSHTCIDCHAIRGTVAHAGYGPDLSDIGGRRMLGAGVLTNTYPHMVRWLMNPQAVKPACYMPNEHLKKWQAQAMARYLEALK